MAVKANQQYYADGEYIDKQAREFQPTMEFKNKVDSIEEGAQVNIIEDIKVNGTSVEVVDKTVDLSIPLVIDNLYTTDGANALSAKQGKVLYDLIQNLESRGRYLSNWNCATGLPVTNPETSSYLYRAGDYFIVSNVAAAGGTNYRPDGSTFIVGQASTTVETETVNVTDLYLYDGTNWNLLINSTREIPIDPALSTTSTNPVENRVVTSAINNKQDKLIAGTNIQIANDGKTISATDTTYTAGANINIDANNEISATDTTYTAGANVQISNSNVISATDTTYSAGDNIDITNNTISATYTAGTGIDITNGVISNTQTSAEWGNITGTLSNQTDLQSALDDKQDEFHTTSTTAPSNPSEGDEWYDSTNDVLKVYDGTQWNEVGAGTGDMLYADFNWVTKTGATITLDLNSEITPSANFTVNAPSTIKDGQIYVLRVTNGATAYTMTLGTGIINPKSVDTTLTASGTDQFVFLAVNGNLELQPDIDNINLSNYLAKDNTTAFTPTGDYNPATKKYVDDNKGKNDIVDGYSEPADTTVLWSRYSGCDSDVKTYRFYNGYDWVDIESVIYGSIAPSNFDCWTLWYDINSGILKYHNNETSSWQAVGGVIESTSAPSGGTGGGHLWWNTTTSELMFYNEYNSGTWYGVMAVARGSSPESYLAENSGLWYDTTDSKLKYYDEDYSDWLPIQGTVVDGMAPSSDFGENGGLWYDTNNNVIKYYDGSSWVSAGGITYTAGNGIDITNGVISVDTTAIQEKLTAGAGIDITNNEISLDVEEGTGIEITGGHICTTESDRKGPAPSGYHIPSSTEWGTIKTIWNTLGGGNYQGDAMGVALKLPKCGNRSDDTGEVENNNGNYWSSSPGTVEGFAAAFTFGGANPIYTDGNRAKAEGLSLRAFKNTPVVPDNTWTKTYGTSIEAGGIFRSSSLGLVSLSGDGSTWITMQDKNIGATTVWNDGDTVTQANGGNFYQWGNNYGFPFTGSVTTSSTRVNTSSYGPGNYYSGDTFITSSLYSYDRSSSTNNDLWGNTSNSTHEECEGYAPITISSTIEQGVISSNDTYEDIVHLTQAEYDALVTKDPNTLYSTPDDGSGGGGSKGGVIGEVISFAGTTVPEDFLECDGSALSTESYADLFAVIGYSYGGSGGTFNLPNLKGRVITGYNSSDSCFSAIGCAGGEKTHTLTVNEIPAHCHEILKGYNEHYECVRCASPGAYDTGHGNQSTCNAGGGQAHNNLQPYLTMKYIIRYQ